MLRFDAVPEQVAALLERLKSHAALEKFALGGGTSLALRFGHRLSVDLDYFTNQEFQATELMDDLRLEGATALAISKNSLRLDANGVKIDLLRHAYAQLSPIEKIDGHQLISLPDLAAMKLNAIANRGSKKDFYDMAELLKHYEMKEMLTFFSNKYPNIDLFAAIRSLGWFEESDQEPDPISMTGQTWPQVKLLMSEVIRAL